MGKVVILDGEVLSAADARISVFDHGFLFGDSVYDVVRTRQGVPFLLQPHLARLKRSAVEIGLEIPATDLELTEQVDRAIAAAGNEESYVRIVVTRGVGDLELFPGTCGRPTLILIALPLRLPAPHVYERGIRLAVVDRRRNDPRALNPDAKTGNYLNNVLAMSEARKRGADDAVMLNTGGFLTELTTANLFFVRDSVVHTPALDSGILNGITRSLVMRMLGEEGVDCREGRYTRADLLAAEEVFLTSTTRDAVPVRQVDDQVIGEGAAGPVARLLFARFGALTPPTFVGP